MPATDPHHHHRYQPSSAAPTAPGMAPNGHESQTQVDELLRVEGLTKRYADQLALDRVSFSVRPGEVLGLIGPNGSGKTTLLECLAGLLAADGGSVTWRDRSLSRARRKEALFYLPDEMMPYGELAAAEVMSFFASAHRCPPARVRAVIDVLELGPVISRRVGALSKGYRRRLLLAVGLLGPQPLLVMDEPFDGLDVRQTRQVMDVLRQEAASSGRTLLLSIHQLTDAERVCDRLVLLSAGRVRGVGTPKELRAAAGLSRTAGLEEAFLVLA